MGRADERDVEPPVAETNPPDLRDVAAAEPAPTDEDVVRVPTADENADAVARGQRALAEIRTREAAEEREAAEHRAEQLARWHSQDQAVEHEQAAERDAVAVGIGGDVADR